MSHPNPEFDRSLLKGLPTLALKKELSKRKQRAQVARDAFFKEKWPRYLLREWWFMLNFVVALLLAYLALHAAQPYLRRVDFNYELSLGTLLVAIVLILSFLPSVFFARKESRIVRDFQKEYPEHVEALNS